MGMFDSVYIANKWIPADAPEWLSLIDLSKIPFQTKDLENWLYRYDVGDNGEIWVNTRKVVFNQETNSYEPLPGGKEEAVDFSGGIRLLISTDSISADLRPKERDWYHITLLIWRGRCVGSLSGEHWDNKIIDLIMSLWLGGLGVQSPQDIGPEVLEIVGKVLRGLGRAVNGNE